MVSIKNRYVRRAKISEYSLRKILKYFADDMSATQISILTSINRNTINHYLNEVRAKILLFCEEYAPLKDTNLVSDVSLGKSGCGKIKPKWAGLDILKRRGKIYIEVLTEIAPALIKNLINTKIKPEVQIRSIDIKADAGIVAIGYENINVNPKKYSYVDSLDNFWQFTKQRLDKFNGIAKHKLYTHFKECEFRFNFRNDDLYQVMLKLLRDSPIAS